MSLLEVNDLQKRYGATVALAGASLRCDEATVHGVVGENGAGKSTLIKIIAGLVKADHGDVTLDGRGITNLNVEGVLKAGVAVAHQELSLVPSLTVAENLLGGRYDNPQLRRGPWLRPSALYRYAEASLEGVNVTWLKSSQLVEDLDLPSQQSLEIAKALLRRPRLLALDEPTSALSASHVEWLMGQIEVARQSGTTIIYISHRLDEVRSVCSKATVFRDGRDVAVVDPKMVSDDEMFTLIAGHRRVEYTETMAHHGPDGSRVSVPEGRATEDDRTGPPTEPLLRVGGLKTVRSSTPIDLQADAGEVVGIAGLQGQGQRELFLTLYGVLRPRDGDIYIQGKRTAIHSPRDAIHSGIGLSLVPEDRKTEGVLLDLAVPTNLVLPVMSKVGRGGFVTLWHESQAARAVASRINLSSAALTKRVGELSGGNQQKVALGKWLLAGSRILLLYDPTRGVDIGTKDEIFALVRNYASTGGTVLFYSTTLEELLSLPDRVEVFYDGAIVQSVPKGELDGARLVSAMLGQSPELTP